MNRDAKIDSLIEQTWEQFRMQTSDLELDAFNKAKSEFTTLLDEVIKDLKDQIRLEMPTKLKYDFMGIHFIKYNEIYARYVLDNEKCIQKYYKKI